jgi:hypothetical protein
MMRKLNLHRAVLKDFLALLYRDNGSYGSIHCIPSSSPEVALPHRKQDIYVALDSTGRSI